MVFKNWGIYGFLGPSWVLITYNICPPVIVFELGYGGWCNIWRTWCVGEGLGTVFGALMVLLMFCCIWSFCLQVEQAAHVKDEIVCCCCCYNSFDI